MNISQFCPLVAFAAALLSALFLHRPVVTTAKLKEITDKPDRRKLQREPVPVLGGVILFFGIAIGAGVTSGYYDTGGMLLPFSALLVMLYTGMTDDILGLSFRTRFGVEIFASLCLIAIGGMWINDFHGLWGIFGIPAVLGIPLTVITTVGIINAINLIDGVDGLSSGYGILACTIFGIFFHMSGDKQMTVLAAACAGVLIPFFFFNVFSTKYKMFIGDGGTLTLGMLLSIFVLRILDTDFTGSIPADANFGTVPFVLAVLSLSVFDTLRVMLTRIVSGNHPFKPDKRHLHHAFIDAGFTHLQTTLSILGMNSSVVSLQWLAYRSGASQAMQLYIVVALSVFFTAGMYYIMRHAAGRKKK